MKSYRKIIILEVTWNCSEKIINFLWIMNNYGKIIIIKVIGKILG